MLAKEIKPGTLIVHNEAPCIIRSVSVQSPSARGAATLYKFRAHNLKTDQKVDLACKGTDNLDVADFEKHPAQMMYKDTTDAHFMDQQDYNQYSLPIEDIQDQLLYIDENSEGVLVMIYNGECIGIEIPKTLECTIAQCDPGVKGNSATSRTKPATLHTGASVQVPEYLSEGDIIRVDTETGKYLGRASG